MHEVDEDWPQGALPVVNWKRTRRVDVRSGWQIADQWRDCGSTPSESGAHTHTVETVPRRLSYINIFRNCYLIQMWNYSRHRQCMSLGLKIIKLKRRFSPPFYFAWHQLSPASLCGGRTSLPPEWCRCALRPAPGCPSPPPPWWSLTPTRTDAVFVSPRWSTPSNNQRVVVLVCLKNQLIGWINAASGKNKINHALSCFILDNTFLHWILDLTDALKTRSLRMEANGVTPIPPPTRTDTSKSIHSWWPSPNGPSKYSLGWNKKWIPVSEKDKNGNSDTNTDRQ